MRIIKQSKLAAEAVYRHTCQNCEAIFEFKRYEATFVSDQREGDYLAILCPCCNRPETVNVVNTYNGPG